MRCIMFYIILIFGLLLGLLYSIFLDLAGFRCHSKDGYSYRWYRRTPIGDELVSKGYKIQLWDCEATAIGELVELIIGTFSEKIKRNE